MLLSSQPKIASNTGSARKLLLFPPDGWLNCADKNCRKAGSLMPRMLKVASLARLDSWWMSGWK